MASTGVAVARGAFISLVGQWAKYVFQIASVVIFAHLLTPADAGLVTAAAAITGVAWILSDFGLALAGLQADELSQDQQSMLFWTNSGIGAIIAAIVCAAAPLIAAFYDDSRLVAITLASSSCFLLNGLTAQFEVALNRAGRFATLSGIGVVSQIIGLVAGVAAVGVGWSYWGLVISPIAVIAVALIGAVTCSGWWPSPPKRGVPMGDLYRFGGQTLGLHLMTYVMYNADSVAIGRVLGNAPLGLYNRAFQLSQVPSTQLAGPLTRVFLPALSQRRHDPVAYQALVGRIQLVVGYVLCGALTLVLVESPAIVDLALGDGWEGAIPVLRVLSLAAIAELLGRIYYWVMLSWARTGLLFAVELGPRIATIGLIAMLVPHGITAVAWAVVIGQVLPLLLGIVWVLPAAGLPRGPFVGLILRPVIAIAVAAGAAWLVLEELPHLPAVAALAVGTLVWLAAAGVLALVPAVRADLSVIGDSARSLRRRRAQ